MSENKQKQVSNQGTSHNLEAIHQERSEVVKQRLTELFNILQAKMEQEPMDDSNSMVGMGMGVIQMAMMQAEPQMLNAFMHLCNEIVSVALDLDLHTGQYEKKMEPLLLKFLEIL